MRDGTQWTLYARAICFPHLALEGELAIPLEVPIKEFFHHELTGQETSPNLHSPVFDGQQDNIVLRSSEYGGWGWLGKGDGS